MKPNQWKNNELVYLKTAWKSESKQSILKMVSHLWGSICVKASQLKLTRLVYSSQNLKGQIFNALIVVEKSEKPRLWICKCACGNTRLASHYQLKHGSIKSC